tara:strand:+ start:534 stop:710 length:177 start_codon:yes stop_codon:yes gene_type:complete
MNTQEVQESLTLEDHLEMQESCLKRDVKRKETELRELKLQLLHIQEKLNRPEQYQVSL